MRAPENASSISSGHRRPRASLAKVESVSPRLSVAAFLPRPDSERPDERPALERSSGKRRSATLGSWSRTPTPFSAPSQGGDRPVAPAPGDRARHGARRLESPTGSSSLTIVLTIAGCPLRDSFQQQVDKALASVPGVRGVELSFGVMTPEERQALTTKLRGGAPEQDNVDPAAARLPCDRRRERQGRRRQVVAYREPRGRVLAAGPARRHPRRRHHGHSIPHILGIHRSRSRSTRRSCRR